MQIQRSTSIHSPKWPAPAPTSQPQPPLDGFKPGPQHSGGSRFSLSAFGMGAVTGAVGVGGTGALGMGSVKAFMTGHPLLGVGLAVGAVASGATLAPMSLMGAAMSTDAGDTSGWHGYLAGAGASLVGSAIAIF